MDRGSKSEVAITEGVNRVYWDAMGTERWDRFAL